MEKNFDVIAMGELLIDFTMNGQIDRVFPGAIYRGRSI